MKFTNKLRSAFACFILVVSALPARAGVPVIDVANLANSIQQVLAWAQQYQQMVDSVNQLQQQYQQLQAMTQRLDGIRSLGTILNDPTIQAAMPAEVRDASRLLMNPSAFSTSDAALSQILASFGVTTGLDPNAGRSAADGIGKIQQILSSADARQRQLRALATRVDGTTDAKDSLDMLNRNTLETASISNQMIQTSAALEAARQAAELRRIARDQEYGASFSAGAGAAIREYRY